MTGAFWNSLLFWVGLFSTGFILTVIIYRWPEAKGRALRVSKTVQQLFVMVFYLLPMLALPLIPQPRLTWPVPVGIGAGLVPLIGAVRTRAMAKGKFGSEPGLRKKGALVTTGVYSQVRNPKYLSNILLAMGWALLFRGIHALLCVLLWVLGFVLLVLFEEKGLEEEYGEAYREYKRKVRWRIIPKVF